MRIKVFLAAILLTAAATSAQQPSTTSTDSKKRVDSIVGKMSLEEKIDYIGGTGFAIRQMPSAGLPAFEMSDGPIGVRSNSGFPSTSYAAGIGLAASWDRDLAERVGGGIGRDARARGVHFMLGPGVNIYRSPMNGRNFEYFGEDPFLSSAIAVGYIRGMQNQGVSATIKHFLGNNSEFERHDSDSIIDERTLREIYLPVFESAVKQARVGAIMDSYNFVNGQHLTQNAYFNTQVARKEWGFDGVMMSDWVATYDGVAAANGGLDLEMPNGRFMNRKNLLPAIQDGRVNTSTIDEKVRHIVQTALRFGWLDRDQADLSFSKYDEANHLVALAAARESVVLLKNEGDLLPLDRKKTKSVLIVGPNAYPAETVGGGSAAVASFAPVSILQGISSLVGPEVAVYYERGLPKLADLASATDFVTATQNGKPGVNLESFDNAELSGTPTSSRVARHINEKGRSWQDFSGDFSELIALFSEGPKKSSRRWTGYYVVSEAGPYELAVQGSGEGGGYRVYVDDKLVIDDWSVAKALQDHTVLQLSKGPHKVVMEDFQSSAFGGRLRLAIANPDKLVSEAAKKLAAKCDAVIIAVGYSNDSESEGGDRTFTLPVGQDELIRELSGQNKNAIVIVTSGGNVDSTSWLDHVPVFLEAWYPGEQGGRAIAEILFGDVNPSGRLPVTFEKRLEDNPAFANYYEEPGTKRVVYKEGIFVGYRGYEHNHTRPLFPFGYGLSYTTFKYANLDIRSVAPTSSTSGERPALYEVSFDVSNTGKRAGAEVSQIYVGEADAKILRPAKELKGFSRVQLAPGETKHISITLDGRAFAYYDVAAKRWHANPGNYSVQIGRSSEDIQLRSAISLSNELNLGLGQ